jgi:hypothetical protein
MASIIAHELEEAATDPDLNAWYDRRGMENADKCAWTFGSTSTAGKRLHVQYDVRSPKLADSAKLGQRRQRLLRQELLIEAC